MLPSKMVILEMGDITPRKKAMSQNIHFLKLYVLPGITFQQPWNMADAESSCLFHLQMQHLSEAGFKLKNKRPHEKSVNVCFSLGLPPSLSLFRLAKESGLFGLKQKEGKQNSRPCLICTEAGQE